MFTNAKWITRQPRPYSLTAPAPYLRKRFVLDKEIESATLEVCAVGFGICEINGKKVTDDLLTTPVSNYDKSVYYNVYDVTDKLVTGKNAIGFILGNGAYNDNNDHWGMSAATDTFQPKASGLLQKPRACALGFFGGVGGLVGLESKSFQKLTRSIQLFVIHIFVDIKFLFCLF